MILLINNNSDTYRCNDNNNNSNDNNNKDDSFNSDSNNVIIYHSTLDLLRIEFYYFSMYGIFSLITRFTNLKSLYDPTFFFIFCFIVLNKNRSFRFL
jgi:hypothetical protein